MPNELGTLVSELYWKGKLDSTYWVCAFSVNQHASICDSPGGDDSVTGLPHPMCSCGAAKSHDEVGPCRSDGRMIRCEINKFDDMMDCLAAALFRDFGQVIAVDADFQLFRRAWCIAEIHRANVKGMPQTIELLSEHCLLEHRRALQGMRVEDMEASNPDDKAAILAQIPDKAAFNTELNLMISDDKGLFRAWYDGLDLVCMLGRVLKMGAHNRLESHKSEKMPTSFCINAG